MDGETRAHLKQLLEGQRVLSLAVLVNREPYIGLLPFAVLPDHSGVLIHVSSLAKHTGGLSEGATVAVLIHQSEESVGKPMEIPRVSLQAKVAELQKDSPEYAAGKATYLSRFPEAAITFGLGDFKLFQLRFLEGRFVEGFARAIDVSSEDLRTIGPPDRPRRHTEEVDSGRLWRIPK